MREGKTRTLRLEDILRRSAVRSVDADDGQLASRRESRQGHIVEVARRVAALVTLPSIEVEREKGRATVARRQERGSDFRGAAEASSEGSAATTVRQKSPRWRFESASTHWVQSPTWRMCTET